MMSHFSPVKQAEGIINRLEFARSAFSEDERNLIVNYAFKLDDMEKTKELAEHIYYKKIEGNQGAALAVIDAQAEIDALPDPLIGLSEMVEYGYTWGEILPLTQEKALEFFDHDLPVYLLHEDGSETTVTDRKQITGHEGIFGIEKGDWENEKNLRAMLGELEENGANKEAQLLYGDTNKYGIYQLKDSPGLRDFQFAGTESLKRRGIIKDNFDAIKPENYNLVYVGVLSELQGRTQSATLEAVYEKFNVDHPADYKGHSLSVSDIVVLHENGENSAHFVNSFGFTGLPDFMRELEGIKEQEIQKSEPEEMQDTSGHDVQKPEPEQEEMEPPEQEIKQAEQQSERDMPEETEKTQAFEDLDDEDEIIDLGDETEQVLAQMKKSLKGEQETELAFQIADRFISIQEVDGGYDYSIMGADYKEIDGGVYDNPDVSIREVLDDILTDLRDNPFDNSTRGNIRDNDELIPIDYNGLMEKAEAANRIEPQAHGNVVENFKAKTNELFHEISEMNPAEIEETVKCHVQAQLDESGIDAEIVDVAVVGSRCRGLEQEGSDLDVVVELSTSEREDVLFDTFNGDALHIGGVKVDINPITAQRTGTLETYLPQVEDYLEGVREHGAYLSNSSESMQTRPREKAPVTLPQEPAEPEVTLTVAECGEFHNLGEFYENIPTVEESAMSKKKNHPHGNYCKICGEYKANEKFSGKGHAAHICKACSRLSAAEKAAAMDMSRLMDFPMRRLSENEKKWLKTKMKDDCPEVADTAREIYNVCFPYAKHNAIKKQLVINTLSFGVHTEVYDEYGNMELVDRHFTIDRKSRVLTMTDFQTEGVEQSVTLEGGQMAKLLRYIVHTLEIFMWEEDYSLRPNEGDYDSFFNGEEDFFMEDLKDGLEVQPIKEPEESPSWWVKVEYTNHTEQDICSYEDYLSDRPEELYLSLLEYFKPEDEVF